MEAKSKQLADATRCGVFQLTVEPHEIERAAKAAGLTVFRMDIGHAHDKKDFLAHIAKAMKFPDHFGGNWDALNDCLTDLEWLEAKGYALVFEKSKHFGAGHKHEFDDAIGVLRAAVDYWKAEGRAFWVFVHGAQGWDCGLPKWPAASQ